MVLNTMLPHANIHMTKTRKKTLSMFEIRQEGKAKEDDKGRKTKVARKVTCGWNHQGSGPRDDWEGKLRWWSCILSIDFSVLLLDTICFLVCCMSIMHMLQHVNHAFTSLYYISIWNMYIPQHLSQFQVQVHDVLHTLIIALIEEIEDTI